MGLARLMLPGFWRQQLGVPRQLRQHVHVEMTLTLSFQAMGRPELLDSMRSDCCCLGMIRLLTHRQAMVEDSGEEVPKVFSMQALL